MILAWIRWRIDKRLVVLVQAEFTLTFLSESTFNL
jgi:hypothetical protein